MGKRLEELKELGWDANEIIELLEELKEELKDVTSKATVQPNKDLILENRVRELLVKMGLCAYYTGVQYLCEAVSYCIKNKNINEKIFLTKDIFPELAKKYKLSYSNFSGTLTKMRKKINNYGGAELEKVLRCSKNPINIISSNTELIKFIANYIRLGKDLE